MVHEQMFSDDDPWLAVVSEIALALPDADRKISHGRPAFFTTKVFVYYGGSHKVDGEWVQHPQSMMVKPDPAERLSLEQDDRVYVPAYMGPSGWLGLHLGEDTPVEEVAELIEASYRLTAGKRRVARLDAG